MLVNPEKYDDSDRGYNVEAVYRTPLGMKAAEIVAAFISVVFFFVLMKFSTDMAGGNPFILLLIIPFYVALRWYLRLVFRRKKEIQFYPGSVHIGKQHYEARRIGGFGATPHEKAEVEEREVAIKVQTGKLKPKSALLEEFRLFQESAHILMEYQGQPIIIADVYGIADAERLAARLNALLDVVNDPMEWAAWEFDRDPVENRKKHNCHLVTSIIVYGIFAVLIAPYPVGIAYGIVQLFIGKFTLPEYVWYVLLGLFAVAVLKPVHDSPYPKNWLWIVCKPFSKIKITIEK